ncbi:12145_t:CDS:10 [Ambispora gerdemannii]|uniref:12145_t:CDS:1 n=1 Tax=Ambispora gerdemannii TaxID=144530 RepID=A0A9N8V416_9GLOM|nr:12145_t:CDS:10 [Ambispora gerdemannii]
MSNTNVNNELVSHKAFGIPLILSNIFVYIALEQHVLSCSLVNHLWNQLATERLWYKFRGLANESKTKSFRKFLNVLRESRQGKCLHRYERYVRVLDLERLRFSHETLLETLQCCPRLELIILRGGKLDGAKFGQIAEHMPNIKVMKLKDSSIYDGNALVALAKYCPNLEELSLKRDIECYGEVVIEIMKNCPRITRLIIEQKTYEDDILKQILLHCPNLGTLILDHCINISENFLLTIYNYCPLLSSLILTHVYQVSTEFLLATVRFFDNAPKLSIQKVDKPLDSRVEASQEKIEVNWVSCDLGRILEFYRTRKRRLEILQMTGLTLSHVTLNILCESLDLSILHLDRVDGLMKSDILAAVSKLKNLSTLRVHFQTYEVNPLLSDELKKIAEACPSLHYIEDLNHSFIIFKPKKKKVDKFPKFNFGTTFETSSSTSKSQPASSNAEEEPASAEETDGLEALRAMLPTSFGVKKNTKVSTEAFAKTRRKEEEAKSVEIGPLPSETGSPAKGKRVRTETSQPSGERFESDTLALDPAGARLITGSYDYDIKFWDFAGMDSSLRPFRSLRPCGDHQIHHIEYSLSGDQFLIISGSARPKLYDRDGFEIEEYIKGDPYIRDMRNTSGHVAALTSGGWHPHDKQYFFTASADSTIRLWDVENKRKQKQVIVFKTKERGGRTIVTATVYSPDAKLIAAAAQDGNLCLWPANGPYARPSHIIEKAHSPHSETSSIIFSRNNWTVVTRGGDDTVKVWDTRNFKSVVSVASDLPSYNPENNAIFNPDERTAVKRGAGYGKLVMMDRNTLQIVRTISITQSSVIRVLWHSRINQIITGSADGSAHVFYDPNVSVRGAKLCVVKEPKKRSIDDFEINRPIIAPHSLALFRDDRPKTTKRKREKLRKDPIASRRPDLPVSGPGKGGKIGSSLTQHIMKDLIRDTTRDEDPREALLKFATISETDPKWIGAGNVKKEFSVHINKRSQFPF